MKKILILAIITSVITGTAQAEIFRESRRIPVFGNKTIDLQDTLRFTPRCEDEVITELGVTIESCYRPGVAHFFVNGIELVHADIAAERDPQRIFLPLPFKVLYERDLDIVVTFEGQMTVSEVGLGLSGDRFDRRPVRRVEEPVRKFIDPPAPVSKTVRLNPDRWATRYNGNWGERVRSVNDRGAGVRDGWDYPNAGMIRDGRTANFQPGSNATLLHAYFPAMNGDVLERAAVTVCAAGSGEVEVGLVSSGRTIRSQRLRLSSSLRSQEVVFDNLNIERSALGRIEVWVKNPSGRALQVDGIDLRAVLVDDAPPPVYATHRGRR